VKGLTIIGYVTFAFFVAGCASGGNLVEARNCPAPEVDIEDYSIGVGDRLNIVVWRNDELSASVPVRPDGKISTPLIDDMQAAGKTPSNLAENMEDVLGEYIRTPEVSVIVTGQGAANQIQVVGEVLQPQALSYREDLRMLDVIVAVGGMTDFAAGNRTKLVRQVSAGQVECSVRLKDLVSGDMAENVAIFPGDVIVVPESRF
jgi:polysaccharide export outer membrane protein